MKPCEDIDLLLNRGSVTASNFYAYRHLGRLLAKVQLPWLPLHPLVNARNETHTIDSPRFLGSSKFGPGIINYHEGRKHLLKAA